MVLILNFCIHKLTNAIAFKIYAASLSLIKVKIAVCKFKIFAIFVHLFCNENASLQTGRYQIGKDFLVEE